MVGPWCRPFQAAGWLSAVWGVVEMVTATCRRLKRLEFVERLMTAAADVNRLARRAAKLAL